MIKSIKQHYLIIFCALLVSAPASALDRQQSCYEQLELEQPEDNLDKALYILVDQTMPLSASMRANINKILEPHPRSGELVRIARFAPNTKGQYTELLFEGIRDSQPSEAYLYHLRDDDNRALLTCLKENETTLKTQFNSALQHGMGMINTSLPKTEILHALKRLSETVLINDNINDKTVLIISDGMENSEVTSFYRRKSVKKINVEKELEKVTSRHLLADWRGAKVYMYGLGTIRDPRKHIKPSQIAPLEHFWRSYFNAGGAIIKELGTPAILSSHLQD